MNTLKMLAVAIICCVFSCTNPDQGDGFVSPAIDDFGLRACEFSCDPGSSSGVYLIDHEQVGNQCCYTFDIKFPFSQDQCVKIRTWNGQTTTIHQTVAKTDTFTYCFVQGIDCFLIELGPDCNESPVGSCDVFDNECT